MFGDTMSKVPFSRPISLVASLGHVEPVDLVDCRATLVILFESPENDLFARQVAMKIERPSAHRIPAEQVAELQRRLLADDVALLVTGHAQREDGIETA